MDLPHEDSLRWIVRTLARLQASYGESFGKPALVQPTSEFFPDAFQHDGASVERMMRRLLGYTPVADDLGIELAFLAHEGEGGGGCGSSACGTGGGAGTGAVRPCVHEVEDGYRVFLSVTDVGNPDVLAAALARAAGELVLHEAGEDVDDAAEAELAAVAAGLGVLIASGSSVWAKSCGGLRMAQATALSVEESTFALALFVGMHGLKASAATANLGATQREAFDLARAWTESNPRIVEALGSQPALLEGGLFSMEPVRGLLGRWLHKRKVDQETAEAPVAAPISDDKRRRLEEARALVEEVMGGE